MQDVMRSHRQLSLAGDGRCDSPGHSALFGTYSLMDTETGKIVCFELIKVLEEWFYEFMA